MMPNVVEWDWREVQNESPVSWQTAEISARIATKRWLNLEANDQKVLRCIDVNIANHPPYEQRIRRAK